MVADFDISSDFHTWRHPNHPFCGAAIPPSIVVQTLALNNVLPDKLQHGNMCLDFVLRRISFALQNEYGSGQIRGAESYSWSDHLRF